MLLDGKVAIITGGALGIGRASCEAFAAEGARIAVVDWDEDAGNETLSLLQRQGRDAIFVKTDVSKIPDIERAVEKTLDSFGKIDTLFNNAGINRFKSTLETEESDWQALVDINLKGSFFFAKAVVKPMAKNGGGSILFNSSVSGVSGEADQVAYAATKGGIIALVTAMAKDLWRYKIRVNCILPSTVDTHQFRGWMSTMPDLDKALAQAADRTIMGRLGKPQDIAEVAAFLASNKADYITGIAMPVDGGRLVRH
jgi:NAD(P)-dependent dehydrogenase (short-subunit alcohol dehydrogenase family)